MTIKLDKEKKEKEKIKQLLLQSIKKPTYELECIVGGNLNLGSNISYNQFRKIISRINGKKEFITKSPNQKLSITFPFDSKFKSVRVNILGFKSINDYCNNENIESIHRNVIFETKQFVNEKLRKLYINNYNLKFNQKSEKNLDMDTALIRELLKNWKNIPKVFRYKKIYQYISLDGNFSIDCSVVKSSNFEDNLMSIKDIFEKDLIQNVMKPLEEKAPFKDWWEKVSKNKSNKVKVRNLQVYYKSIKESKVFENDILYEVEIEYIGNKKEIILNNKKNNLNNDKEKNINNSTIKKVFIKDIYDNSKNKDKIIDTLFSSFFLYIGIVLQCAQDSFYIMGNNDKFKVYKNYIKLTNITRPMEDMFFGPLSMDLDKNKMIRYQDNIYEDMNKVVMNGNILLDYSVTDKTDGSRALLYIDVDGEAYLVSRDSNSVLKKVGVQIKNFANSIFDGEFIEYDINKKLMNGYFIFDCYYFKGKDVMNNIFGMGTKETERLFFCKQFSKFIDEGEGVYYNNDNFIFKIKCKNFLFGAQSSTNYKNRDYNQIFTKSKQLLDKMNVKYGGFLEEGHSYPYETDGLIFTPVNLSVYQTNLNNKVPPFIQKSAKRWSHVYKWKDNHHLTIDFKIEFVTNVKTNLREYVYIDNNKYLKAKLKTRNYDSFEYGKKSKMSHCVDNTEENTKSKYVKNIESQMSSILLNNNLNLRNLPGEIEFIAANPFLGKRDVMGNIQNTVGECLIPVVNEEIKCKNGDIIYNNQVVEFSYKKDMNVEEHGLKWIPERLRLNKVPNAFNTCLDIWYLINNPVSKELVSYGLDYGDVDNKIDLDYYLVGSNFYTNPVKKFNNFCTSYVLDKYLSTLSSPDLLDMGCGKMGDFFKYVHNNVRTLVGIDINADNLNNKCNGAASRILNNIGTSPKIKKLGERTLLILGNICKSMSTGELASDDMASYFLDILYGKHKPSPQFNKKHGIFYNMSVNGFHAVTCKYVIHYCLNNIEDMETFFENVSSNLKDQGYFIGTCLDGNVILNELNNTDNKILEGKIDGNLIWSISRNDLSEDERKGFILDNNLERVGKHTDDYSTTSPHILGPSNKVNIYFETFNSTSQENLVDIKYLELKAKEYGLKLIESRIFTEEPGNLMADFGMKNSEFAKEINKEKHLSKWADYQRYFVFQKVSSMNSE